jgi:lipopolysaccharide/colanic/teichoic acid biosynthesis glycosyltransferase
VATSERILTTISSTADFQRVSPRTSFGPSARPVWRQFLTDFVTISLVLTIAPGAFGRNLAVSLWLSPFVVALMITTLFAFAGSYPRRQTPLAIGDTAGLVRGLACAALLLVIFDLGKKTMPGPGAVVTGSVIALLLVLGREIPYVFVRHTSSVIPQNHESLKLTYEPEYQHAVPVDLLKRAMDFIAAAILLVLAAPLFVCTAALIKLDTKGPVFIRQRRIGKGGVPFLMWKFRSMHRSAPRYERSPVSDKDPRLTSTGRVLRRLSIDELPQLLNVLQGDMSLVGPRPEMPFIVATYGPRERLRLNAVPGITGLWQISPARAMPIHQNLEFDFFYIESRTFFLDVAILLRTMTAIVRGIGAT